MSEKATQAIARLMEIMHVLRSPEGCPWDAAQTPESLRPYILEEAYEVLEAIDSADPSCIRDELGDLLLQVVFQARLFEERGAFDLGDVARSISDKLVRRHPHVFGGIRMGDLKALDDQWDRIKSEERRERGDAYSALAGVPSHLPALVRARKLSEKASRVGFDWPEVDGIFAKIHEELREFDEAMRRNDQQAMSEELGDLLFAIVNLGRFLDIDAEESLRGTANRFVARFEHIERTLASRGRILQQTTLEEMEALWQEAKAAKGEEPDNSIKT